MKLVSLKILGKNFRSLTANHLYKFNVTERESRLSAKCFAGLNGSGKSNMLEVISEIFYYLDHSHLLHGDKNQKEGKGFGFELEYHLPMKEWDIEALYGTPIVSEKWMHIQIKKPINEVAEYSFKPIGGDDKEYRTVEKGSELLLPKNIIAYSSGQNELISNPFYKLKYHYFNEIEKLNGNNETSDRLFFIDQSNNFNVFISNFLIGDERKLKVIKVVYAIEGLSSFRITINDQDYWNKKIQFSDEIQKIISKLKACSTCWDYQEVYGKKKRHQFVFDFSVNKGTVSAFKFHFENSAMNLFKAFYHLDMLNIHMQQKGILNLVQNGPKWLNLSDEIPAISPDEQVFRIEKIKINKVIDKDSSKTIPINYKNLSDGEHQFNEVIGSMMLIDEPGSLLLYDEPDTHFNPKWRSSIMSLFNKMAAISYDKDGNITKVQDQEVILTTHSPFAISDSYKEDVYIFEKTENGVVFSAPKIPTYGASVSVILEHVFMKDKTIASISNQELENIKAMANSPEGIEEAREHLIGFGESIEKFNAVRYLRAREKEFTQD
ncbi:restriction system-associated AAA family ATPase [Lentimicrobium sp. L6]|uniref:restriction system-associated AAA family ATPase n=1 Tax=Lentimicrobium sp. L6 TaxID=2735916 RepID=UPI00155418BC|nr:restriction system-associated AAA family ATPase [Lentimicrobium sp. L6]NPD86399.1 restriction system-associated AAA family ATPase [Lentimicrobium sp. L6]